MGHESELLDALSANAARILHLAMHSKVHEPTAGEWAPSVVSVVLVSGLQV
jgi:hypothetical protein